MVQGNRQRQPLDAYDIGSSQDSNTSHGRLAQPTTRRERKRKGHAMARIMEVPDDAERTAKPNESPRRLFGTHTHGRLNDGEKQHQ